MQRRRSSTAKAFPEMSNRPPGRRPGGFLLPFPACYTGANLPPAREHMGARE